MSPKPKFRFPLPSNSDPLLKQTALARFEQLQRVDEYEPGLLSSAQRLEAALLERWLQTGLGR